MTLEQALTQTEVGRLHAPANCTIGYIVYIQVLQEEDHLRQAEHTCTRNNELQLYLKYSIDNGKHILLQV